MTHAFFEKGWHRFPHDETLARWVAHVLPKARETIAAPENAEWFRYANTWFAGVNVLQNDEMGRVGDDCPALAGTVIDFIHDTLGLHEFIWDRGQVSVCYPGYPQPMEGETAGAHRYRRERDAAHLDGLIPEGPKRRRYLREHHGFILGIPMTEVSPGASPLVVWEGSHQIIRTAFRNAFDGLPAGKWGEIDVTKIYQETRREIFERCPRTIVHARPGEAYLVHRLALHGVAPWDENADAGPDGRMIIYFRPEDPGGATAWLNSP